MARKTCSNPDCKVCGDDGLAAISELVQRVLAAMRTETFSKVDSALILGSFLRTLSDVADSLAADPELESAMVEMNAETVGLLQTHLALTLGQLFADLRQRAEMSEMDLPDTLRQLLENGASVISLGTFDISPNEVPRKPHVH